MSDALLGALQQLFDGWNILYLVGGVYLGLLVGILPGMGGSAGLAVLLPFVFGMDPGNALAMMIGLMAVTPTSDTFPSVLLGIPGGNASQATVLDGFPMAQRGEGARALSAAFAASLAGGIFGALVLTLAIYFALPILLAVGFGEQMILILLALTMVGTLTGASALKGVTACCIGLLLGTVGTAPATGVQRATFGSNYLIDGIPLIILGLGIFALPEIIDLVRRKSRIAEEGLSLGSGWIDGVKDTIRNWSIVLRCSFLGVLIGALPGLGGSVTNWVSYGHVVQTSKDRSQFGKGDVRGVIAPESANNAQDGGGLIPTLLFGIPGSGSMALLLAGFILIGIEPGIEMVTTNLDLTYTIVWSLAIANIIGAGTCVLLARPISRITTVPAAIITPFMIALIFLAAFQATRDWGDLLALMAIAIIGVYMKRFGWPRPAFMIGFVLAPQLENGLYRVTQVYGWSFLERPLVLILLVVLLAGLVAAIRLRPGGGDVDGDPVHMVANKAPQLVFLLALAAAALWIFQESFHWSYAAALMPRAIAGFALLLLAWQLVIMLTTREPNRVLFDNEHSETLGSAKIVSNAYYLALLAGILIATWIFGFLIAIPLFVGLFLFWKAGVHPARAILGSGIFLAFLALVSWALTIEYPEGILTQYFDLL